MEDPTVGPRFDFDFGQLQESPCRRCNMKEMIPECIKTCELIGNVQSALAGGVSCTLNFSPGETYNIGTME